MPVMGKLTVDGFILFIEDCNKFFIKDERNKIRN